MNLALLDPFRRQIPDRIDSTLTLPRGFHPRRRSSTTNNKNAQPKSGSTSPTPVSLDKAADKSNSLGEQTQNEALTANTAIGTTSRITSEILSDPEDVSMEYPLSDDDAAPGDDDANSQQQIHHSCHAVCFNRRGTYLAAGHASGALPVHEFASRTLSSIHYPPRIGSNANKTKSRDDKNGNSNIPSSKKKQDPPETASPSNGNEKPSSPQTEPSFDEPTPPKNTASASNTLSPTQPFFNHGVTSVTWSRRSRQMLTASYGDAHVCLVDNTHPLGPSDVGMKFRKNFGRATASDKKAAEDKFSRSTTPIMDENGMPTSALTLDDGIKGEDGGGLGINSSNAGATRGFVGDLTTNPTLANNIGDVWKRARVIPFLQTINPNSLTTMTIEKAIGKEDPTMDLDEPTIDRTKARLRQKENTGMEMTTREETIDNKPSERRTMEERHLHALMSMRLKAVQSKKEAEYQGNRDTALSKKIETNDSKTKPMRKTVPASNRYQTLIMRLPQPITGAVQIHPEGNGGLACLEDGSLVLFSFPRESFQEPCSSNSSPEEKESNRYNTGKIVYLMTGKRHSIACASFGKRGQVIYAATNNGKLLGFNIPSIISTALSRSDFPLDSSVVRVSETSIGVSSNEIIEELGETFHAKIPGGAMSYQLLSSQNGKMILVNSQDCSLRLYGTDKCWEHSSKKGKGSAIELKPRFTFQDAVSKHQWASCDFSGDGEYVVGGCNNKETGDKYELYLWNTATGVLLDQLTGPQVSLYSLAWHPTRSFIAVGTSDGLIDIWGPRMDWTAFAPDFQALQKNVEYVEREDEFDIVIDGDDEEEVKRKELNDKLEEQEIVDVINVDTVPAFDSDSEEEENVFSFDIKIRGHSAGVKRGKM